MLIIIADLLVMRSVNNDFSIDVLEEFSTSVNDGSIAAALHLKFNVKKILVVLQVAVLEVKLVAALYECK